MFVRLIFLLLRYIYSDDVDGDNNDTRGANGKQMQLSDLGKKIGGDECLDLSDDSDSVFAPSGETVSDDKSE